jgi:hypothetical protein
MDKRKLGVIVPYRDRFEHLQAFKNSITEYLNAKGIFFELIIVEQDDAKAFNRGKLLNIGFKQALKLKCNYVVFHDVDMIPTEVDYSYVEAPTHLASERASFDQYFGGVTIFPIELFKKVNGYSNEYWGWGFEDDDLFYRCMVNNIPLNKKKLNVVNNHTAALKFNGYNAYVEGVNKSNSSRLSITVFFEPQNLILNHETYDDEFTVFSFCELNLRVSYDSYTRYKTVIGTGENLSHITSQKLPQYKTSVCITIDKETRVVTMYQDGKLVGEATYSEEIGDKQFYLGSNKDTFFFSGFIHSFALHESVLLEKEIKEIAENKFFGLTQDFGDYESSTTLKTYYDARFIKDYKLIDLVGSNKAILNNCEIVPYTYEEVKTIDIPFRKKSRFKDLFHEDNGFVGSSWKNITTRYNQLKFSNEVAKGYVNTKEDGLSNLTYKEYSNTRVGNQTHLVVDI